MSESNVNTEFIIELAFSIAALILTLIIPILFVFWLFNVFKKLPKIGNPWFLINSNRRFFKNKSTFSLDKVFKAIREEREHKKKYYKKNKFF